MNDNGDLFGAEGLLRCLDRGRAVPLSEGLMQLQTELKNWCGETGARDDVSILAVEIAG